MSDQPSTQSVRERLTKLFEFLKAYTDLRFPPVCDIARTASLVLAADLSDIQLSRTRGAGGEPFLPQFASTITIPAHAEVQTEKPNRSTITSWCAVTRLIQRIIFDGLMAIQPRQTPRVSKK